ncbi:uncharacterized protein LOC129250276 [Anastrepha obliqua]|uniref:uncharacterized protein LOC129250276 n=1 Tax=Anastrepha obliqua TaxID=95512 RepID=UPI00240A5E55|nr:uncharacterized protein LOC129250276 [Anastrepha obliqua]
MNNEIKVYFLFLSYVLPLINNLNKEFQSEQSHLILQFEYLCNTDCDKIVSQWTLLKLSDHNLKSDIDIDSFWQKVSNIKNGLGELMFPDLTSFIFTLLSLPHSSAVAERKFSSLKLIKTNTRNKLEIKTIHHILTCKELIKKNCVWSAKKDFSLKMD